MFNFTIESLTFEQIVSIFLLILLPGIVFMYHLRLWIAMDKVRASSLIFAVFLGTVNFILTTMVLSYLAINANYTLICLLFFPAIAPPLWKWFSNSSFYRNRFVSFYDNAFDFAINTRQVSQCVVVHLKSGKTVAGLFVNGKSFLTASPNSGDLFLSVILKVNDEGVLVQENNLPVPVNFSRGLYIPADSYDYLEFFEFEEK